MIEPDLSLSAIEETQKYYSEAANRPKILATSDRSPYVWTHVSNFYGTDLVLRDGPISPLPERPDAAIGAITVPFADGTRLTVDDYFAASTMDAMIVLREGAIVYERTKTLRPFDKRVWFSCSKTIVATMIALLEDEGRIDVAQPVSLYLPDLAGSVWDSVTLDETLDMATGLDSTEHEEPDARTNPMRGWYQWAASIGLFEDPTRPAEGPFEVLRRMKREKPAHTVFEYNSINTFVCQMIVERLTGVPLAESFGARIWRRIGAAGDGYFALSRQGRALAFGFMNASLRDLARYGMIFTPSGAKFDGEAILPESVARRPHRDLRPDMYDKGAFGGVMARDFPLPGIANRYQWDIVTPDGDQFKAGLGGQGLYISAPNDSVVAFFSTGSQRDESLGAWTARTITQTFR
ncbi:serine hydrolase domain-containing protein [Acuticoccus kandeliae]|uniref:serine hydrolase domain-containing protein n=1 Tax=Acuticoccus kandeliae TaxID=2073160 RepID=UPI0013008FFC|nr:serine hydrolase domain-containing protein [Acuticoccus kandeliae]